MAAIKGRVTESGRISLPAELRRVVGLDNGGDVVIELEEHGIRIRPVKDVVARAQMLTRKALANKPGGSVDEFLAARKKDHDD